MEEARTLIYAHAVQIECFTMPEFAQKMEKATDIDKPVYLENFLNIGGSYTNIKTEDVGDSRLPKKRISFIAVTEFTPEDMANEICPNLHDEMYALTMISVNSDFQKKECYPQARMYDCNGKQRGDTKHLNLQPTDSERSIYIDMVKATLLKKAQIEKSYNHPQSTKEYNDMITNYALPAMNEAESTCMRTWFPDEFQTYQAHENARMNSSNQNEKSEQKAAQQSQYEERESRAEASK